MSSDSSNDLIIACSTGESSNSAISVLRIDGSFKPSDLDSFFERPIGQLEHAKLTYNYIIHEQKRIDQVLVVHFAAPKSFTGNDIIEIHVHGNRFNVRKIIQLFCQKFDARLATPGEFTLRALKNKKLNLAQVEGLDILLNANSSFAYSSGLSLLHGELFELYTKLYESMTSLLASVELFIDFSEDVGHDASLLNFKKNLATFDFLIDQLDARLSNSSSSLLDPTIVLFGKTNSGKSTLFNSLLNRERSIVSSIEGTTRDYVVEPLMIDGETFRLIDTAGIRETSDPIEGRGIEFSNELLQKSFYKIKVISAKNFDRSEALEGFDLVCLTHLDCMQDFALPKNISNKISVLSLDLSGSIGPLGDKFQGGPIEPPEYKSGPIGPFSGYSPLSIKQVKEGIYQKFTDAMQNNPILNDRQVLKIKEIKINYIDFKNNSLDHLESDVSIVSSELKRIKYLVEELLGIITPDAVLDVVFKNFCIGK